MPSRSAFSCVLSPSMFNPRCNHCRCASVKPHSLDRGRVSDTCRMRPQVVESSVRTHWFERWEHWRRRSPWWSQPASRPARRERHLPRRSPRRPPRRLRSRRTRRDGLSPSARRPRGANLAKTATSASPLRSGDLLFARAPGDSVAAARRESLE
jgi:hypothetical protein